MRPSVLRVCVGFNDHEKPYGFFETLANGSVSESDKEGMLASMNEALRDEEYIDKATDATVTYRSGQQTKGEAELTAATEGTLRGALESWNNPRNEKWTFRGGTNPAQGWTEEHPASADFVSTLAKASSAATVRMSGGTQTGGT